MANHTLFNQATPTGSNGGGGATTGTYGLQFSVSSAQTASGIWFYSPSGATVRPDVIGIFDSSGNLVQWANPSWSGAAGTGWILATFAAPAQLATGTQYVAVIHMPFSSGFWNVTDTTYWSSGAGASGITSGPLTAPGNSAAVHGQNSFVVSSGLGFPNTSLAGNNIWMDIQVTDVNPNVHTVFSQNPVSDPSTNDNSTYTMGMQFQVTAASTSTAIWWYSPYIPTAAADIPTEVALYDMTSTTMLADQIPTWSGPQGSGWVRYQWTTPITLTVGHVYQILVVKQGSGNNWYAAHSHYWDTTGPGASGLTSGPITVPNDANARINGGLGVGQDSFHVGATLAVPNSDFGASNYWVDVEVTTPGTSISESDKAGANETLTVHVAASPFDTAASNTTFSVVAHVTFTDNAAGHDTFSASNSGTNKTFNDYGGSNDVPHQVIHMTWTEHGAGLDEFFVGTPQTLVKILTVAVNSLVTLNSSVTIGVESGAPIQGGMRQLALDRWNYMYPSN